MWRRYGTSELAGGSAWRASSAPVVTEQDHAEWQLGAANASLPTSGTDSESARRIDYYASDAAAEIIDRFAAIFRDADAL
jgi:hypothetical protein